MWLSARKGNLNVGDEAPDFSLETYDNRSRVQLSDFKGKKPVVLVFGSYT
jgi:peroxiredoxin